MFHKRKLPDHLNTKLPEDDFFGSTVLTFFDARATGVMAQTVKRYAAYQETVPAKRLLELVLTYTLTGKEQKTSPEQKQATPVESKDQPLVNPILLRILELLKTNPGLALEKNHGLDPLQQAFYGSALECAYLSGNAILCELLFEPLKQNPEALKQLSELIAKGRGYEIELRTVVAPIENLKNLLTAPQLKPSIIKHRQAEDKEVQLYCLGKRNGLWQLTELLAETRDLFATLEFPKQGAVVSQKLSPEFYKALRKFHTPARFHLSEYLEKTSMFKNKWIGDLDRAASPECYAEGVALVGCPQKRFPAWLAQIWCSNNIKFFETFTDLRQLVFKAEASTLKTDKGLNFFEALLGKEKTALCKGFLTPICLPHTGKWRLRIIRDLNAMEQISALMETAFEKLEILVEEETEKLELANHRVTLHFKVPS